jgi:hypothetical protein
MVTKDNNWETLKFNIKSMNPEYFPSSYLSPVPTLVPTELLNRDSSKKGAASVPSFPRSTITGNRGRLSDFAVCLSSLQDQQQGPGGDLSCA